MSPARMTATDTDPGGIMRRLRILTWPVHGGYLNALVQAEHDWYLPTRPGQHPGYLTEGSAFIGPDWVHEIPAERIRDLDLDLILYQSAANLVTDGPAILSSRQCELPRIYVEHNVPPRPFDSRHPFDDPTGLLVHVTHYNRLMWDNGQTPTAVIEHSVAIDPAAMYRGTRAEGITVVNEMPRRGRAVGYDVFQRVREQMPLTAAGMDSESFGGLGDIPYPRLHRRMAEYRFLFSPMRYTSLPLAVVEAMTIGMPIVALATTELPTVIEDGVNGYVSSDPDYLTDRMRDLLADVGLARRLGANARAVATRRFGPARFIGDWNAAFARAIALRHEPPTSH